MPRSSNATRTRIKTSAYTLFHRKGFARVGIGEIAAAAGVTKRSLYYHFRSKDDLLAVVLEDQHELALATFKTWAHRLSGEPEKLIETMFSELAIWTSKPTFAGSGFTRVIVELADLPGHPGRAIARRHKAMVEAYVAELFAAADIPSPRERAREVYTLLEGATALILVHGDRSYAKSGAEAAKALLRHHRAKPVRPVVKNLASRFPPAPPPASGGAPRIRARPRS
jgi:AcrR family transcriptional regulator